MQTEIVNIIAVELGVDPATVSGSSRLVDDLGADSPHLYEVAIALEEKFNVKISDHDLAWLKTVDDFVAHVQHSKSN